MKAKYINNKIQFFGVLPTNYTLQDGRTVINFHLSDVEVLESEGFFDIITPEIQSNEKLGEIYFDEENKVFTYPVIEKTQEELEAEARALIPQTISQRQLRTQLVLSGFILSDVQIAIDTLPEPNKSIAQIAWDYAVTFERSSELLISLALMLGINEEDLDNIFINASQL